MQIDPHISSKSSCCIHNAHSLLLKRESLRKRAAKAWLLDAEAVA